MNLGERGGSAAAGRVGARLDRRRLLGGLTAGLATVALAGCGEMPPMAQSIDKTAAALGISVTVIPGESTEPLAGAKLVVEDGKPSPTALTLAMTDATVLHVVNRDDTAYMIRIGSLVDKTPLAAKTTTILGFTSPDSGQYAGDLLSADGANTLGHFTVNVTGS